MFTDLAYYMTAGLVPKVSRAEAATGDFAIFREATGVDTITTATFTHNWDTEVATSSSISLAGTGTNIELESGHYAVMYGARFDSSSGNNTRSEVQSGLNLNSSYLPIGWSQGHVRRRNGADEAFTSGGGIINVTTASDVLQLHSFRTDSTTDGVQRAANTSGIQVLKLDDTWDYARLSKTTTQTGPTSATWVDVTYNRQDELDTGSFSHTSGTANLTLKTTGHYLVFANTYGSLSSASRDRTLVHHKLTLNGTDVDGSYTTVYSRGSDDTHQGAASIGIIVETSSANEILNVEVNRGDGSNAWTINADSSGAYVDRTALTVVKLPDDADYIRLDDSGTDNLNPALLTALGWNTEDEKDTDSFTHSTVTNDSRVSMASAGDYLFFSSNYAAAAGVTYAVAGQGWRLNGTGGILPYGQTGSYNRSSGADDLGNWAGTILHDMTSGDYVEVMTQQLGDTGTVNNDIKGIQGVSIDSLFALPDVAIVSATGSQVSAIDIPSTNKHVGGTFTISHNYLRTISSVTLTASGTVDATNDLDNIKLYYENDTSDPYDCAGESYVGTETQFGTTDIDGFSITATSTFTGTAPVSSTSTLCMYAVLDVGSGASDGETLDIEISDPSTDIGISSGIVTPSSAVSLSGMTVLRDDVLTQTHYHWRNDDGLETDATSATGGTEDTVISAWSKGNEIRLRLGVSNEGSTSSASHFYRIEYAEKLTTCSDASGWTDVDAVTDAWDMYNTTNLSDGSNTTNVAVASGGVSDENTTFLAANGGVKDATSQTVGSALSETEFIELEYSMMASTTIVDGTTYCFRVTNAGTPLASYSVYPEITIAADVLVGSNGSQVSTLVASSTGVYLGGQFAIINNTGAHTVTGITITENGSIDASTGLDNIELYYETDTSDPYDCVSENYAGTETQFGATDTDGFSGANGTASFSGSVGITSTQSMCVYVVLNTTQQAARGDIIDIEISVPSTEVTLSAAGSIAPTSVVLLAGTTTITDDVLTQTHYHWRNDDGLEADATSATGGVEDTLYSRPPLETPIRLRVQISNEGDATSSAEQYRLEYGLKTAACSAVSTWIDVGGVGGAFDMATTTNLTDGGSTTNVAVATGGVTDENTTFLTPNGGVKDSSSQTGNITLEADEFVELEYSLEVTSSALENTSYCFRVSRSGSDLAVYSTYPELKTRQNKDYYIQRDNFLMSGTTRTLTAGVDYEAPSASTSAFIRITNTHHTGAGDSSSGGSQNADDVTVYVSNPWNITSSITFTRYGGSNDTFVAWEIVEYTGPVGGTNEMIVRAQSNVTYGSTATTTSGGAVSGVSTDADIVVFITGQANPDTGRRDYNTGQSTAEWLAATDTPRFSRGEASGDAASVSYAVVEYNGSNWIIQRAEHTYSNAGLEETTGITSVNSTSRAFLHTQKRAGVGLFDINDFGHEVWLSAANAVSFRLDSGATLPSDHTSVAWVIENTQTNGTPMAVTRSSGTQTGGSEPSTISVSIGKTLDDVNVTSVFTNNRTSGTGDSFPRAMMGVYLASTTAYELWVSDTGLVRTYRTEVVEWPTAVLTINQNYYRFYVDNDLLDPTDPWPVGAANLGENTSITLSDTPIAPGDVTRIRMSLAVSGSTMTASSKSFKLQYGKRITSCSAIASWTDVGAIDSAAQWRGTSTTPVDGTALSGNPPTIGDLNLTVSDRAGTFENENDSALNPFDVSMGEDIEYDWVVENNGADDQSVYCFRTVYATDLPLDGYNNYPTLLTAGFEPISHNWRWYDDDASTTPAVALANENVAPSGVNNGNAVKLRISVRDYAGKDGNNQKFKLQFSEQADFSSGVFDVEEIWSCDSESGFCYFNGAGIDNAKIASSTLSDADSCVAGVGDGCGTHNESGTSTSSYTHPAFSSPEYEFTIIPSGAQVNTTFYFRLYDMTNSAVVTATTTGSYPSLNTQGGILTFTIEGLPTGTTTEGITTDVTTTPISVPFGTLTFGTEYEAAQRMHVTTNSVNGYALYTYQRSGLSSDAGSEIQEIAATNASPLAWALGCGGQVGCFGYHPGDDLLSGGSSRFTVNNSYAAFSADPSEVAYNSGEATDEKTDIVYKVEVANLQEGGSYEASIVYILVPVF